MFRNRLLSVSLLLLLAFPALMRGQTNYPIIDTGLNKCYDDSLEIAIPNQGEPFYGQDAQYDGIQFSFQDNGDGTVTDLNTGLMWQQTPDFDNKQEWADAVAGGDTFSLAGHNDWRLPTIKELYSLINFNGTSFDTIPYIDTTYFDFEWGDTTQGERLIDAQYWSNTKYVGTTMNGDETAFGVNFADGRIKGYPTETGPGGSAFRAYVRYVRDGSNYGENNFVDNGDGTITDLATGLMWTKIDSDSTYNWEEALAYAENLVFAGYDDWRLPNTKELQSIVDYTRAPDASNPEQQGPAIDTIFDVTEVESWCWTSTTHLDGPFPTFAVYVCFGQAWGYMGPPGQGEWLNVHGAGAQRSDPKSGNPANWPWGHGPQGDQVRIYNYVRCVRGGLTGIEEGKKELERGTRNLELIVTPNPFTDKVNIYLGIYDVGYTMHDTSVQIYDLVGRLVRQIPISKSQSPVSSVTWDGKDEKGNELTSGVYYIKISADGHKEIKKLLLVK